jgi:hypothetical protein
MLVYITNTSRPYNLNVEQNGYFFAGGLFQNSSLLNATDMKSLRWRASCSISRMDMRSNSSSDVACKQRHLRARVSYSGQHPSGGAPRSWLVCLHVGCEQSKSPWLLSRRLLPRLHYLWNYSYIHHRRIVYIVSLHPRNTKFYRAKS